MKNINQVFANFIKIYIQISSDSYCVIGGVWGDEALKDNCITWIKEYVEIASYGWQKEVLNRKLKSNQAIIYNLWKL